MADNVNHPDHYTQGGIECIDAMRSMAGESFAAHLRCTVLECLWSCDRKNCLEDLFKARWYLDKLIDEVRAEEGRAALAEMSGEARTGFAPTEGGEGPGMVERPCSDASGHARIGYGIGAGEKHDADDSEHGEFGKKGCMKTLYGPVTGFCREGA